MVIVDTTAKPITPAEANCVQQATLDTLGQMSGSHLAYEGEEEPDGLFTGVVGIISLVGDVSWSVMLGLPPQTASALATSFAGFEVDYDSEDMNDLVGELANILAGDIAARLEKIGKRASLSLPTVARGEGVVIAQPAGVARARLRFALPKGSLWLTLGIGDHQPA